MNKLINELIYFSFFKDIDFKSNQIFNEKKEKFLREINSKNEKDDMEKMVEDILHYQDIEDIMINDISLFVGELNKFVLGKWSDEQSG